MDKVNSALTREEKRKNKKKERKRKQRQAAAIARNEIQASETSEAEQAIHPDGEKEMETKRCKLTDGEEYKTPLVECCECKSSNVEYRCDDCKKEYCKEVGLTEDCNRVVL